MSLRDRTRALVPAWLWRVLFAVVIVAALVWLLLCAAWVYVLRGQDALVLWFDHRLRSLVTPMSNPKGGT